MSKQPHPAVGDIWYRVDGVPDGDEVWAGGAELDWKTYRVEKVTPCGAWMVQPHGDFLLGKPRFAMASGCRWCHRTKEEALKALIRRKRYHLRFLERDTTVAEETLRLAKIALEDGQ